MTVPRRSPQLFAIISPTGHLPTIIENLGENTNGIKAVGVTREGEIYLEVLAVENPTTGEERFILADEIQEPANAVRIRFMGQQEPGQSHLNFAKQKDF
ncbi:MAG: hypothetical protein V1664_00455 [Candidatus Uhrbacteria bacterium]